MVIFSAMYPLRVIIIISLLTAGMRANAQAPRHYVCYQTREAISIDGLPTETSWQQAVWTEDFSDIEGDARPAPLHRTRVKMCWDAQHLYIFAELTEPHIWATLRQHDTIIFHDNDFEVFIDPDGDTHQYFEIEINALNTVMDLFMSKPYRNGGPAMLNWDTKGLRTAVHINGTLNNPADKDRSWTVEMAIPFKALAFFNTRITPEEGATWRINFSRVQWQTDVVNGRYVKRPKTPEYNWVWSPQGIINMHAPEKWGYLQFSAIPGTPFREPATAGAQQALRELYHRQQRYRRQHGHYTSDPAALGWQDTAYQPVIEATSTQFTATIRQAGFVNIIDHEGKIIFRHE
ncbi:carbohydrate-binding family 9-like protein [Chitinophaga sp. XS-30]|uniref:carbohydrate-binding family 9-like protein n=1 Tax=Chitinophaga sp. XS-30 TaxID=2604421 RepID=UPI0011DDC564|nr:carbohydrate-binding family 9-like protein [Chitinophaga sp. XS-30]QEH41648.1 carbohydrate-binding family 9-like protein [Chitinophaga sp. XS-30]